MLLEMKGNIMETLQERLDELNTKYIVYGKTNCPFCEKAKNILTARKEQFEYLVLDKDYTREELLQLAPDAKTVPQIWLDSNGELFHIGGYTELVDHFRDPVEAALNEGLTLSVVFTKADGSERTMLCTKDPLIISERYTPEEKKTDRTYKEPEGVARVFDLEKNEWRSFRYDSVKSYAVILEDHD
jgi:glutaredoxin 3